MSKTSKTKKELVAELESLRRQLAAHEGARESSTSGDEPTFGDGITRRTAVTAWVAPVVLSIPVVGQAGWGFRGDPGHIFSDGFETGDLSAWGVPTSFPTQVPTFVPTASPTTSSPTASPTTASPTLSPTTMRPTFNPTMPPTTASPTMDPTLSPTTMRPTFNPTMPPTTASPTMDPTLSPTFAR